MHLRQIIKETLGYRNLEDAKLPVHIVATDILSGSTVVMSESPAAQAIIASAAVPAALEPVYFNDLNLVPPLYPLTGSPYDLSQTSELIERAARSTDAWLSEGGLDHSSRSCTVEHAQARALAPVAETK
jgi:hypothetical protein